MPHNELHLTDVPIGDGLQPVVASELSLRLVMGPWLLLFIVGNQVVTRRSPLGPLGGGSRVDRVPEC
jgi:hypothetical protein